MSIPPSLRLPSGVEPLTVTTHTGELAALRSGEAPLPDILMVPGFTGSKEDFLPLLPLMAERGWSSWAIDQHGQYQSTGPAEDRSFSLTGWGRDVLDLARHAGGVHLLGHSFGGLVSREAVLADAEPFHSLTLLNSGPGALPERHHNRLALLMSVIPELTMEQIWQAKTELERADGVPAPPAEIAEFLHTRWITSSPGALHAMARALTRCPDRTADLAQVVTAGLPCLVAYGEYDDTSWHPDEMALMALQLGSPAVVIPEAAHSPAVETPAALAELLDRFLRQSGE